MVNSGPFDGTNNRDAIPAIIDYLEERRLGRRTINFRLKDWGISRQRYWGTPIPMIYCDGCGVVPVPYEDLPVVLPLDAKVEMVGRSPLADNPAFYNVECPRCGKAARRETDTMDTFVESSWYFLKYASPHTDRDPPRQGQGRLLDCPWTSISAAWSTPSSISSTPGSSTGSSTSLDSWAPGSLSKTSSPRAW